MAAISSILIGASIAAGVAGTAISYNEKKKASKAEKRRLAQQKLEAENAAALEKTRTDTGAKVKLGAADQAAAQAGGRGRGTSNRTGTVDNTVGGLGAANQLGL